MGFLTWLKLGAIVASMATIIYVSWNYQHRGRVIEAQKEVIEQQVKAEKFYKAQPKVDEHVKEMVNEAKKAAAAGDTERVRWLYDQLRMHKIDSGKSETAS